MNYLFPRPYRSFRLAVIPCAVSIAALAATLAQYCPLRPVQPAPRQTLGQFLENASPILHAGSQ